MSRAASKAVWQPKIRDEGGGWFSVESEDQPGHFYKIDLDASACNCPGFHFQNRRQCKHITAVKGHMTDMSKLAEQSGMTTEQTELLSKLSEAAGRMSSLGGKARSIGCTTLETDLALIAKQLTAALKLQRRALSPDPAVRTAAIAESELPFRVI